MSGGVKTAGGHPSSRLWRAWASRGSISLDVSSQRGGEWRGIAATSSRGAAASRGADAKSGGGRRGRRLARRFGRRGIVGVGRGLGSIGVGIFIRRGRHLLSEEKRRKMKK